MAQNLMRGASAAGTCFGLPLGFARTLLKQEKDAQRNAAPDLRNLHKEAVHTPPPDDAADERHEPGACVNVTGLRAAEHNGRRGVVLGWCDVRKRYKVELQDLVESYKVIVHVKHVNILGPLLAPGVVQRCKAAPAASSGAHTPARPQDTS